jgi:predicted TIM-barrel fold metal-dependent hydrolase
MLRWTATASLVLTVLILTLGPRVVAQVAQDPTTVPAQPPAETGEATGLSHPPATTMPRPDGAGGEVVGTGVYAGDTILLDYYPKSQLKTPQPTVEAAKFPAVDVHCHWSLDEDPAAMLEAMDRRNLSHAVNLSGGNTIEEIRQMRERFDDERFLILCNLDYSKLGDDAFYEKYLKDAKAAGAAGLKIWKNLGLTLKDADGERVAVDDPRLDVVWRTCGELGMPVLIHVADPAAFFDPIDASNERWLQLYRHPNWSFYGPEFLSREQILEERDRMIARHPGTNFIGAHVANEAEDLASVAARMRKLPNLYADISGRVAELGRQPYTARRFFLEFPDRILFGTDRYPGRPSQPRYKPYFKFLETDAEYFDYYDHPFPPTGEWKIYGIFLPDEVLKKVYAANARKLFGL